MNPGALNEQRPDLHGLHQAELLGLLDAVLRVTACIGQPENFCAGCLRADEHGGEIAGLGEWILDAAQYPRSKLRDYVGGVTLQRLTERIIGGDEEPSVATFLHNRTTGGLVAR